jgi:hypothetical protein
VPLSTEVAVLGTPRSICTDLGLFEKATRYLPPKFAAEARQIAFVTAPSLACPHEPELCATAAQGKCPKRTETWPETPMALQKTLFVPGEGGVDAMRVLRAVRNARSRGR